MSFVAVLVAALVVFVLVTTGLRWLEAANNTKRAAGIALLFGLVGVAGYLAFEFLEALVG